MPELYLYTVIESDLKSHLFEDSSALQTPPKKEEKNTLLGGRKKEIKAKTKFAAEFLPNRSIPMSADPSQQ
ncbi:hypothetical protein AVEN_232257-1, partial [Araneus ventricosus]